MKYLYLSLFLTLYITIYSLSFLCINITYFVILNLIYVLWRNSQFCVFIYVFQIKISFKKDNSFKSCRTFLIIYFHDFFLFLLMRISFKIWYKDQFKNFIILKSLFTSIYLEVHFRINMVLHISNCYLIYLE